MELKWIIVPFSLIIPQGCIGTMSWYCFYNISSLSLSLIAGAQQFT